MSDDINEANEVDEVRSVDRVKSVDAAKGVDGVNEVDEVDDQDIGSEAVGGVVGTPGGERPAVPAQRQRQSDDAEGFVGGVFARTDGYGRAEETATAEEDDQRFFPASATEKLRDRWQSLQIDFVDDPRRSVEQAEDLVEQVSTQLVEAISARRRELHGRWSKDGATASAAHDDGVATEDLRAALQEYRQVFNQLLTL